MTGTHDAPAGPAGARDWDDPGHARHYLAQDVLPHRAEAEAVLVDALGPLVTRVLDLGAGDGRVLGCVLEAHPGAEGVALDHNPAMLDALRERFSGSSRVDVVDHDLAEPLPVTEGTFDAVVSALAVHHLDVARRLELYGEVRGLLRPGGVFADLDLVRSPTEVLHDRFIARVPWSRHPERSWDRHPSLTERLEWTTAAGFVDVDCLWKWRELALVVGEVPISA